MYTTKLDRSGKDFKEREKRAEKLAAEIMGSASVNPHIQEERGQNAADDSGQNEEDKYGAVVRGPNAYVPPAARRAAEAAAATGKGGKDAKVPVDSAALAATPPAPIINTASVLVEPPSERLPHLALRSRYPHPLEVQLRLPLLKPSLLLRLLRPAQALLPTTRSSRQTSVISSPLSASEY